MAAADAARSALATLDHTCPATCTQISLRAVHGNLYDGVLARRVSHEVAALHVVLSVIQYPKRNAYEYIAR